ncbi:MULTISPECIES: Bug family tripartite tricarboxylate transporter substrate binding protein [unclassified Delftia]|uniref:Bug family tripartite tricarboxylate transporter substrate binding protein n=1 Tax=unclassified Delftia TaxID=2613839 RepID=UPI000645AE7A|nr:MULTISPECIES: tripartite tricarboxylate transporter substrate binding protein [unclassified Delftia]MDC2860805.1 tripartite tricarboxylate transporter substrate binding protein [Delftia sp. DT-2]
MNHILRATALALAALTAFSASAQAWPERPVTLVVPFPAGGSTDQVARAVAPRLGDKLRQSFVVENKAGATGTIGAAVVQRAAADGQTFLVTSLGPLVIVPHLIKNLPYDALKDFDLITVAVQSPNVLVVPAASPHKSVADVVAHLKAHPGKMSFASAGHGSSDHLTAELFWQQTGTQGVHIPYKGGAPAHADLIGGQVDASFQNINAVIQHIRAGKMRALAVTSPRRSPVLPDLPTLAEAGVKNVEVASWQAIVAPKGLPPALRDKAHAAFVEALNDPRVREQFVSIGYEMVAGTPQQFAEFQRQEYARWKSVIEAGKISID